MTSNKKSNINLHIDELVLDGISTPEKSHVASAVSQELHRLLNQGDVPRKLTRSSHIPRLDGGKINLEPKATSKSKGSKIARNLYGGLQK